jgi:ABC-type proline/glycine betaine transport system substrate-binding protein
VIKFSTSWLILLIAALVLTSCGDEGDQASGDLCPLNRPIIFAGLDWDSNAFHTSVASFILKNGYGCPTEIIPGTTIPLIAGLRRGDVDIMMEVWRDNITESWMEGIKAGEVDEVGVNFPDAVQGFYVPRYMIEGDPERGIEAIAPALKSVFDLPKYKTLMIDPEEPEKGRFYNCILGWSCEQINTKKLEGYGLLDDFTNFRPGTGAALASAITSNYERGKPFVAYYWGPTWILGKYDLVMLEEPPYTEQAWRAMSELNDYSNPVAYPLVPVVIGVNSEFKELAPDLVKFLESYETSNQLVSNALAFIQVDSAATSDTAAFHFLRESVEIWSSWLPKEIADNVAESLEQID